MGVWLGGGLLGFGDIGNSDHFKDWHGLMVGFLQIFVLGLFL